MDIMKFITEQLNNPDTIKKLAKPIGVDAKKVQQVTQLGIPALLQALGRNTSTSSGARALAGALDQHKDDKVDNITDFLKNVDTKDGAKMLQHIFSGNNDRVQNNLARQTGMKKDQVSGVLTQLAPLLIGALGQQKKEQKLDESGISGLLNGLMGQGDSGVMGLVTNMLDKDQDGSIVDDIGGMLGNFFKK